MKYTVPLFAALLMLVSCKQNCTISGTATGPLFTDEGHYIALMDQDYKQLDSCRVKDGTFTFTCPLNPDDMLTLVVVTPEDGLDESTAVIIIPDSKAISVDMDNSEVSGSPLSEEWIDFQHTMMDKWTSVQEEAVKMMEEGDRNGAVDAYTKLESWIREYAQSVVEKHLNDPVGIQALSVFASMSPADETLTLYEKCGEVVKKNLLLSEFMENLKSNTEERTDNFIFENDGNGSLTEVEGDLDSYVGQGKYTLIDFWASWCGPCRAETPNVIAVYNKYKDKGLVVVGVTVGDKPEDTKQAVSELGIPYDQVVDVNGSLATKYGVGGIPHIILLDPDGNIIAKDLRGSDIETAVKRASK